VAPFAKHVTVRTEYERYQQVRHINSWLKQIQARARWVLEIDVDEFVYVSPRSGFSDIPTRTFAMWRRQTAHRRSSCCTGRCLVVAATSCSLPACGSTSHVRR
jgi:hypothetical protein